MASPSSSLYVIQNVTDGSFRRVYVCLCGWVSGRVNLLREPSPLPPQKIIPSFGPFSY